METLVFVALVLLLAYGLQRNHDRQSGGASLGASLAGSTDAQDRDAERVQAELRAARC